MFVSFFYKLRSLGVPITPTAFLTLHRALLSDLVSSLGDFYTVSRCTLIKSERYFDIFDQVFAHHFHGAESPKMYESELDKIVNIMLEQWLQNPKQLADVLNLDLSSLQSMSQDELVKYFKKRLQEQKERHDGGSKWIGTGGTSPVGHSGHHPSGMRVGGVSRNKSAIKIAMERRYKDYDISGPITQTMMGEALKKLKKLVKFGPKDQVNIEKTVYLSMKNGGEIEICFDQRLQDRIKIMLAIDNGGWSMDPYIPVVYTLFHHSSSHFKDIKTYFFHNTIYETMWKDPERYNQPINIKELAKEGKDTRLILVGDASMSPYEIMAKNGSIYATSSNSTSSIECLKFLAKLFPHSVWLNPVPAERWNYTKTIDIIGRIFPMFELTIDGLEKAISHLKN